MTTKQCTPTHQHISIHINATTQQHTYLQQTGLSAVGPAEGGLVGAAADLAGGGPVARGADHLGLYARDRGLVPLLQALHVQVSGGRKCVCEGAYQ